MSGTLDLLEARAKLFSFASAHPLRLSFVRKHGLTLRSLADPDPIAASCGLLAVAPLRRAGRGRFEFAGPDAADAFPGAAIEVFGRDGRTVVDLAAWHVDRPVEVMTLLGSASMLGLAEVFNAWTYALDRPLRIWRSPVTWLQQGGRGAVVLDPLAARQDLLDAIERGCIAGEDRAHSEELMRLVSSLVDRKKFVVPLLSLTEEAA